MKIWMIWARDGYGETSWLVDAWDDDSVAANFEGWAEALTKAHREHGGQHVRVVTTNIDFGKVQAAFEPAQA